MADRPKRTLCQPKRLVEKYCIPSSKRRKKPVKDNNLYEIPENTNLCAISQTGITGVCSFVAQARLSSDVTITMDLVVVSSRVLHT